jgi:hypothetical protein
MVYRLVTTGTIEEKIYRKQIFKGSLFKNIVEQDQSIRSYFTKQELRELFTLDDVHVSNTHTLLLKLYSSKLNKDPTFRSHLKFLKSLGVIAVSEHDLLFSDKLENIELDADNVESVSSLL